MSFFFYPDTTISVFNLVVSIIFVSVLFHFAFFLIREEQYRMVKYIGVVGVSGGLLVSVFESINSAQLLTVPLYILIITPLFGLNFPLNLKITQFSLIVALVFISFILVQYFFRKKGKVKDIRSFSMDTLKEAHQEVL